MTPQFSNIFSKKQVKKVSTHLKPKIIIDYREKNSLLPSELIHLGIEIEFKELKVADYIVKDILIERKTISDFIQSMINKRLSRQINDLKQYPNKLLIIEGVDEQELYYDKEIYKHHTIPQEIFENHYSEFRGKSKETSRLSLNPNAIRGFLLSILIKHKIPILFTKNYKDTAKFIAVLSKKQETESTLNHQKKAFNQNEQKQYILESFPGIGPKTAKKLLREFKTIKKITNASEKELQKVLGKKALYFKKIINND